MINKPKLYIGTYKEVGLAWRALEENGDVLCAQAPQKFQNLVLQISRLEISGKKFNTTHKG